MIEVDSYVVKNVTVLSCIGDRDQNLKFINKNYNPKCYVVYDNKNGVDYLNLVVKHLGKSNSCIWLRQQIKLVGKCYCML